MFQDQIISYIRENQTIAALVAAGILLLLLLFILFEVVRTRREVHKICKKIRRYFEVVLTDDVQEAVPETEEKEPAQEIPVYQTMDSYMQKREEQQRAEELLQKQKDAKLLMDIIQEVF